MIKLLDGRYTLQDFIAVNNSLLGCSRLQECRLPEYRTGAERASEEERKVVEVMPIAGMSPIGP